MQGGAVSVNRDRQYIALDAVPQTNDKTTPVPGRSQFTAMEEQSISRHTPRRTSSTLFQAPTFHRYLKSGTIYQLTNVDKAPRWNPFDTFIDLLLSCVVSHLATDATKHANTAGLIKFALAFYAAWSIWSDHKSFMAHGRNDALIHRMYTLCVTPLLVGLFINAVAIQTDAGFVRWVWEDDATKAAILFLISAKCVRIVAHLVCAWYLSDFLISQCLSASNLVIASICYLISLSSSDLTGCAIYLSMGFVLEMFSRLWLGVLPFIDQYLVKCDRCTFPVAKISIQYSAERKASFVAMTLGQMVADALFNANDYSAYGLSPLFGRALLVLVVAFAFNCLYHTVNLGPHERHALDRHWLPSTIYSVAHWPLCAGLILCGTCVGQAVTTDHLSSSLRYYWGGGLSISIFCLFLIGLMHQRPSSSGIARKLGFCNNLIQLFAIPTIVLIAQTDVSNSTILGLHACILILLTICSTLTSHCFLQE